MSRAWAERFRPHLADVALYGSARRTGRADGLLLDANENALGPVTDAGSNLGLGLGTVHRYPDPAGGVLRSRLASYLGVPPDNLWIGSGADDVIDVLLRTLLEPGQELVTIAPTYELYGQRASVHGARCRAVPLVDAYDLDVERTVAAAIGAPLVILCSPNNPTGNLLDPARILAVLERTDAVVAVDEAYIEFAGSGASLAHRAGGSAAFARLAVIRTFSKAWGLAGLRTGYLVGHPALVEMMDVVGLPYRLTAPAIRMATAAIEADDEMERRCEWLRTERARVTAALRALGLRVLPSDANFLLFFVDEPAGVQGRLATDHGITLRRRDTLPGLEGALRVTLGTVADDDRFLRALSEVLE